MDSVETVVLITADTLRYDALHQGGDVFPFLSDLREESVTFTGTYATGSGTSSAFPGLLASAYPLDHGYRGLNDDHHPVAEQLSEGEVRTVGVTSSSHASSLFGYDRGFDRFYDNPSYRRDATDTSSLSALSRAKYAVFDAAASVPVVEQVGSAVLDAVRSAGESAENKAPYERAETVTDRAIEMLRREASEYPDRDRFVWIHYMEPHAPYYPPDEVVAEFETEGLSKAFVNDLWDRWKENRPPLWANEDNSDMFTERERRALRLFYRIQIRYLDRELGRLFEFVDATFGFDETALFVTSDHGEEFFDHGDLGHRPKLYDELIHVPLVAYSEAFEPGTVDRAVSHVDLGPTVADLLDCSPAEGWRGESLAPLLRGSPDTDWEGHEYVLAELSHSSGYGGDVTPEEVILAVVTDDWKYIRNEQTEGEELYPRDAPETHENDRLSEGAAAEEAVIEELREIAADRLSSLTGQDIEREEMSEELREQLHQLGYIDE